LILNYVLQKVIETFLNTIFIEPKVKENKKKIYNKSEPIPIKNDEIKFNLDSYIKNFQKRKLLIFQK
jgi:hypothetical protein